MFKIPVKRIPTPVKLIHNFALVSEKGKRMGNIITVTKVEVSK